VPADELTRRWVFTSAALTAAGAPVRALPADATVVHTTQLRADGAPTVTVAQRRDEASYRTAVDRAMARIVEMVPKTAASWPAPAVLSRSSAAAPAPRSDGPSR
jgi:hypothetical protein